MTYSAYKLNKQLNKLNIQPWHTPFQIWNQSVVLCPVLPVASWPASKFLRRQVSSVQFSSVQSLSRVRPSATPWITASQASLSIINSRSSLRLMSIKSIMPPSYLILGRPLLLLPSIPPSIRVFCNESTLHMRWPKYWGFNLVSFLPKKSQDWSPSEWTGWISLQSKGLSSIFSNTTVQKHQFFSTQLSL